MKQFLKISILCLLVLGCGKDRPKKPDNLISKDKMVDIIVDMSLLSTAKGFNLKKLETEGFTVQSFVFDRHGIDSITFSQSNGYYTLNLEDYTDIYTKVEDSLSKLRDLYKAKDEKDREQKRVKDSIKQDKRKLLKGTVAKKSLLNKRLKEKGLLKQPVVSDSTRLKRAHK